MNGSRVHDMSEPSKNPLWVNSDIGSLKDIGQGEGLLTEEQLRDVLRRYNLRNGLIVLGRASNIVFNDKSESHIGKSASRDTQTGVFITQFGLAYLANILLISGANDFKNGKEIGDRQNLLCLLNVYSNDLIAPEFQRDDSIPFTHRDMASTMVRIHAEQFEFQFDYVNLVARTIVLYKDIVDSVPPTRFEPFEVIFKRETGLSFEDYFVLVMAVWSASQGTATFRKEMLTEAQIPSMKTALTDEKVTNFLNILSTDYKTFRKIDVERNSELDPVFTKYRFNPLHIHPIIKTDKVHTDPYVVPNTLCLLKKGFGGLYWWFHRYFEAKGRQIDFRNYFGEIFEQYVGKILKEAYGEENVHPEITYPKGKFIDWWVEHNGTIYLFEAKAYQFALPTKQTGDNELLIKEVKSKIVKSIKQVHERMSEIDTYEELAYFQGKKLVPVIVFLEIPLASGHLYKGLINDELEELEKNGLKGIKNTKMPLLNIEELELYSGAVGKIPLEEVFARYENNMAEGFLSTISRELGKVPRNAYLGNVYKDFWNRMTGGAPEEDIEDEM